MNARKLVFFLILFANLGALPTSAQKQTLAIDAVKPLPSLAGAAAKDGRAASLQRLVEGMDAQLMDRLNATRKFDLVSHSDLKEVINKQSNDASGNVDVGDANAAKIGKLAGTKYILVTTIDQFTDRTEELTLPASGKVLTKRNLGFGVVAKVYDTTTGKLLESANHSVALDQAGAALLGVVTSGDQYEGVLREMTAQMSEWVANHIVDVVFPAKVLAKTDKQVTINRGEGSGIQRGEEWRVFAVGKELIDPDTKESLGKEEILAGRVRIIDVLPKFSKAEVIEDLGIEAGAILRLQK